MIGITKDATRGSRIIVVIQGKFTETIAKNKYLLPHDFSILSKVKFCKGSLPKNQKKLFQ
ncbi:hypothetical protein LYNGBM3L_18550 [Moorena producens 3L]|uniref:Uncharacterized protein n=1 Tax=Moorena producens 3L TaxID=489825 RepID=F4XSL7_9CYAN|nr:hypothetical protein LYNGBM3L_18550 [Moorena producens 3L]